MTPDGVYVDSSGNLYIADDSDNRIEEIPATSGTHWGISMTAGDIYTVAGSATGTVGYSGRRWPRHLGALEQPRERHGRQRRGPHHRRHRQQPDPDGGGRDDHALPSRHNGRRHLHHRRQLDWIRGHFRRRRTGHLRPPQQPGRRRRPATATTTSTSPTTGNNRIQEVAASGGTQWGISMTAGDIYTVAGNSAGTSGITGDGGAATSASCTTRVASPRVRPAPCSSPTRGTTGSKTSARQPGPAARLTTSTPSQAARPAPPATQETAVPPPRPICHWPSVCHCRQRPAGLHRRLGQQPRPRGRRLEPHRIRHLDDSR